MTLLRQLLLTFLAGVALAAPAFGPPNQARAVSVAQNNFVAGPFHSEHHANEAARHYRHHGYHTHVFHRHHHWYVHCWRHHSH